MFAITTIAKVHLQALQVRTLFSENTFAESKLATTRFANHNFAKMKVANTTFAKANFAKLMYRVAELESRWDHLLCVLSF